MLSRSNTSQFTEKIDLIASTNKSMALNAKITYSIFFTPHHKSNNPVQLLFSTICHL